MPTDEVIISLSNVVKSFEDFNAVDNISFDIKRGEFITILGPSGCGKTTTLRMIGGFELPSSGLITLNGKDITLLPPYKRPINTVFQRYALFPHLDVYDNVAFGLKLKRVPQEVTKKDGSKVTKMVKLSKEEIDERVIKALQVVDLEELENRDVSTLSGGQQQRVAIARCIVNQPQILLLDEPLGALDLKMRKDMQIELKEMHKKLGITFIYVTHDQEEALTMSDRIIVMKDGVIQQIGTPTDIYNEPKNEFVADFIGESNIYNGSMSGEKIARFLGNDFPCLDDFPLHERVDIVVRPEDVQLVEPVKGQIVGKIVSKIFKGVHYEYIIMVGKSELIAKSTKDFPEGDIGVVIEPDGIHIMEKQDIRNIYPNLEVNKNDTVTLCDTDIDIDLTQLVKGSKIDEEGYIVAPNGKKYDFTGARVTLEIGLDKVQCSDDVEFGQFTAKVVSNIYKGDHYQLVLRSDDDEDFILDTPEEWNIDDIVGVKLNKEDIKVRIKGDISDYEI